MANMTDYHRRRAAKRADQKSTISSERKAAYYAGGAMMALGFLSFFSVFITGAMHFGDVSNFESNARSSMLRGMFGMFLIIAGAVIRGVGARGAAGSGMVLDPEQARSDLEPYSRMAGGMIQDAVDASGIQLGGDGRSSDPVIMITCRDCGKLHEEDSKFCQECGKAI